MEGAEEVKVPAEGAEAQDAQAEDNVDAAVFDQGAENNMLQEDTRESEF